MHELTVCQALLREVERVARAERAECVVAVVVRIGPLAGVEPELLRGAYAIASAGTRAAGAELILERTAVRVECLQCGAESLTECGAIACRQCGDWRTRLVSGDELLLASVELTRRTEETQLA